MGHSIDMPHQIGLFALREFDERLVFSPATPCRTANTATACHGGGFKFRAPARPRASAADEAAVPQACWVPSNPRGGPESASFDPCQPNIRIPRKVFKGGSHLCAPSSHDEEFLTM